LTEQMAAVQKGNGMPMRDSMEVIEDEIEQDLKATTKKPRVISNVMDLEREELRKVGLMSEEPGHTGVYGGTGEDMLAGNNSLEGGLTREGDSFYGALALPSVSRGTIETEVSLS
jgi:hypothetical protein